jgi:hypothetical protein
MRKLSTLWVFDASASDVTVTTNPSNASNNVRGKFPKYIVDQPQRHFSVFDELRYDGRSLMCFNSEAFESSEDCVIAGAYD